MRACPSLAAVAVVVAAALAMTAPGVSAARPQAGRPALTDPSAFTETAPDAYQAVFDTTAGMFVIRVQRVWAPNGADRFFNLVKHGFYDGCRFFRVIPKFAVQFGIHGDPAVSAAWHTAAIAPDRSLLSNTRSRVTFAMGSLASSRTTQVFINLGDNSRLDIDGFAPFGEIASSMLLVERIFSGYGEGPDQGRILQEGNAFLVKYLPRLDYIRKATIGG